MNILTQLPLSVLAALVLLIIALLFFVLSIRQKKELGLPGGKIVYTDMDRWQKIEIPLYHPMLKVAGQPDYIIQQKNEFIPIEVKTGRTPNAPYDSHIYQLATYCLLIENEYRIRPSYGIIHYPNKDFEIEFTPQLESATLEIISEMHQALDKKNIPCSHQEPQRCRACGYRKICDESLV